MKFLLLLSVFFFKFLLDFGYKNKKNEDKIPASEDRP